DEAGNGRPANRYAYMVKALEPDHEVDRIVDIQFDGRSVGPFIGDPNDSTTGVYVAPGSFYYKQTKGSSVYLGTVSPTGSISVPSRAVTRVLALSISDLPFDVYNPGEGGP